MAQTTYEGGCDCGQVRYQLLEEPLFTHACHCRWCQRETGSAFVINVIIESHLIDGIRGAPQAYPVPTASGGEQYIFRCTACMVALWSCYGSATAKIAYLRAGTLDEPDLCPPQAHIYTSSKQRWLKLDESAKASKAYYNRAKTWPKESLDRLKVLV